MIYELDLKEDWAIVPASEAEEIFQNVRFLLLTRKGTCPLDRELGLSQDILDTPMNRTAAITAEVAKAINQYEPRARLKTLTFSGGVDGKLEPHITLEIMT